MFAGDHMEGYVDEYGQGRVRVGVIGRKKEIAVDAVIDTTLFLFLEKRKPVLKEKIIPNTKSQRNAVRGRKSKPKT